MYARTNRCYNERGSRTNYVRSSTPHCSCFISDTHTQHNNELWGLKAEFWWALANCEQGLLASSCLSVRLSSWNNSAPTWPIFMKFNIWGIFFKNMSRKVKSLSNLTTITGALHEDLSAFMIIHLSLLERETFQTKFLCRITFSPKIVPLLTSCGKIMLSRTGQIWQYHAAHALCALDI
jgi:hypothetical protein